MGLTSLIPASGGAGHKKQKQRLHYRAEDSSLRKNEIRAFHFSSLLNLFLKRCFCFFVELVGFEPTSG
jgi:hypothetical protein